MGAGRVARDHQVVYYSMCYAQHHERTTFLMGAGPLVTGQQPQGSGLGFAARGNLLIGAPEQSLAKQQMLQLFRSQAEGAEQLEGIAPARAVM
jgi:hypothetical protein